MRKFLPCLLAVVLMAGVAFAQTTPINDIQYYNPETGAPESPYAGQQVSVIGTVYVPAGIYNSGTHYILGATGGISFFQSGTGLVVGDQVEVSGEVSTYGGEIQLANVSVGTPTFVGEPTPVAMTPDQVLADYENVGLFASVIGTVVAKSANSNFELQTSGAENLIVYIDSTTGIDLGAVDIGDEYQVLSPIVVYNGLIELKPRYQSDLIEDPSGDTVPVISNVACDNYVPLTDTAVAVSATITDNSAVQSASLYFRDIDGETPGAWASVAMVNTGGDVYEGIIPAPHTGDALDYYVSATDDGAQTVTLPGDAPVGFYSLAVGITPIYTMQWVHPDSSNQDNPFMDKVLNIKGVVTAGTGEVGSPSKFIVQEQEEGPYGGYAFGGVLVYEGSAAYEYYRGDVVEIGGHGNEYFGLTEMEPHNGDAVNLVAFGGELPAPERVKTRILADDNLDDGNGKLGEAYESVWVKTYASLVMGTSEYDEFYVSDTGAPADTCEVEPAVALTYVPTIGDVIFAEGYMDYSYGAFQVTPTTDAFLTLTTMVGVGDTPTVEKAGGFKAIYPNPFNPATKINFVLNRDELAQLNIYNIRGELVRSLVNEQLPMGDYVMTWDGRNDDGQNLASGQYFARLRIGKTVMQVRKLSLVK